MAIPQAASPKKFNIDFDKFEKLSREIQDFTRKEAEHFEQSEPSHHDDRSSRDR